MGPCPQVGGPESDTLQKHPEGTKPKDFKQVYLFARVSVCVCVACVTVHVHAWSQKTICKAQFSPPGVEFRSPGFM